MTKEEYYNSPKFFKLRLLNNFATDIKIKAQEFDDILRILLGDNFELSCSDKFALCESQSRIVSLEAHKLCDRARKLADLLEPHQYDDVCKRCNNNWVGKQCPTCDAVKPALAVPPS